jgi:hypothetical protein
MDGVFIMKRVQGNVPFTLVSGHSHHHFQFWILWLFNFLVRMLAFEFNFCFHSERPYFCRAEPEVFQSLFGVKEKNFNKEACRFTFLTHYSIYSRFFLFFEYQSNYGEILFSWKYFITLFCGIYVIFCNTDMLVATLEVLVQW